MPAKSGPCPARVARRRAVGGLMLSIGLTSLLTGVTEPIEFTFMFVAPVLYALHAILTGLSMVLMQEAGVHLGFSFSAGLFDYVLNFTRATRPLWLLPIGAGYFALYYVLFRQFILRFNLTTPGREPADGVPTAEPAAATAGDRAAGLVAALGGTANLTSIDACTTRLRLTVADASRVDPAALVRLGALGVVQPAANVVQVVLGPVADQVAGEMRRCMRGEPKTSAVSEPAPGARRPVAAAGSPEKVIAAPELLAALGGKPNVIGIEVVPGRLLVRVASQLIVDRGRLEALGVLAMTVSAGGTIHILIGPAAAQTGVALTRELG